MQKTSEPTRKQIIDYWESLGKEGPKKDRKELITLMARHFDLPEPMIEKRLADWEAGTAM